MNKIDLIIDALEGYFDLRPLGLDKMHQALVAAHKLKAELAKPEQEPQMIQIKDGQLSYIKKPWFGLTDEQLSEIYNDFYAQYTRDDVNIADFILIARAIEAKLKERNT
jgi:hypothetical protein